MPLADATSYLTPETMIPLGGAITVGVFIILLIIKLLRKLDHMDAQLTTLTNSQRESWTVKDQVIWQYEMQLKNPTLVMPNAAKIAAMNDRAFRASDSPI